MLEKWWIFYKYILFCWIEFENMCSYPNNFGVFAWKTNVNIIHIDFQDVFDAVIHLIWFTVCPQNCSNQWPFFAVKNFCTWISQISGETNPLENYEIFFSIIGQKVHVSVLIIYLSVHIARSASNNCTYIDNVKNSRWILSSRCNLSYYS